MAEFSRVCHSDVALDDVINAYNYIL